MLEIPPAQAYCAIGFAVIASSFPKRVYSVFCCGGINRFMLIFVIAVFFVQLC
jgi:hypothetical protein